MVNSSCGTSAVGSDKPASDQVTRRAAGEIARACQWWDTNRPAAPGALRQEIERVFRLIAHQPGIGARAVNARLVGVRRVHLSRVHYHLYYRARSEAAAVEVPLTSQ